MHRPPGQKPPTWGETEGNLGVRQVLSHLHFFARKCAAATSAMQIVMRTRFELWAHRHTLTQRLASAVMKRFDSTNRFECHPGFDQVSLRFSRSCWQAVQRCAAG